MTTQGLPDRVVAVAIGEYAQLISLPRAVQDNEGLAFILKERHGFDAILLADRRRGDLLDEIDGTLAANALPGAALILLWTGHGKVGPDGRLRLLARTTDTADDEVATAGRLGELAARTGATQVLVILDTCFSGGGVPDAYAMANAVLNGRADPGGAWFGVVAASRGDEPARSGAMARELARLLTEGPADPELRLRWSTYQARVRGDDLIDALVKEWSEPRHSPQQTQTGNAWPMLGNPLHRPRASQAVVEHLLRAARGTSSDANFFTGRDTVLAPIVAWMRRRVPGLFVVTGPPGSGKSAILGRIVSLSTPEERNRLTGQALTADLDPGESSVDVHLHARGLGHKAAVDAIVAQLGLGDAAGIYDLLAFASRRRTEGQPLIVVVDGLDEAGQVECREIAVRLIEPLAREALVLVGTREVPGAVDEPGLLALLGSTIKTVDLGTNLEDLLRDVGGYAVRRLRDISPTMNPELVADEIVKTARAADPAREGPFLLARLVTSQLREAPVDTAGEQWRSHVASSVEAALENDLQSTVLTVGGQVHPTAARELLHALTYAYGSGMPADDVWPTIATAISPTATRYTRHDVYALLVILGRHVVVAAEGDQAVYKVAHQRLVDHLRPTLRFGLGPDLSPTVAEPIADAVAGLYEQLLDEGQAPQQHTYLWLHAWRHLADAGPSGIELLRRFVARDRSTFLPDLAGAIDLVTSSTLLSGSAQEAVTLAEELVSLRRELDDRLDLATALFDLALARGFYGDAEGADRAASEAVTVSREVARQAHDDPIARLALASGFSTQAVTRLRGADADAAWHLAVESVKLTEAEIDEVPGLADALAGACSIAARAALMRGDTEQADVYSKRALAVLDERLDDQRTDEAVLLEILQVRALVELIRVAEGVASAGDQDVPRPAAAERIVALYREVGATGTISDIHFAEGMRLLALTSWLQMQVKGDADAPDPAEVLDNAVALVSEIADRSADATLALAESLTARARMTSEPARAIADLEEAERRLKPIVAASPLASAKLGEVISIAVRISSADDAADLSFLIERQYEAVDLLDIGLSHNPRVREMLYWALVNLVQLLQRAGMTDEAISVLDAAVEEGRALFDGSPSKALNLAAMLADLAAGIAIGRAVEAIEFATEAIDILQPLDVADPIVRALRGICETNLSAAYLVLNRQDEARQSAERAIELLGDLPDPPLMSALATALNNLAILNIAAGENEAAVEQARRAAALLDQVGPLSPPQLLPLIRISMGQGLRALGFEAQAAEALSSGIAELRTQLTADEETFARLAHGLNAAGAATWDTLLADLAASPEIAIQLALHRSRPPDELNLTIGAILDGLRIGETDPSLVRSVHELARAQRSEITERFDALWVQSVGEIPDWLSIDPWLSDLVVAWWNAGAPQRARSYLQANPALLDPATDILLEEIRADGGDGEKADLHLQIRADAAAHGIESAYAPIIAEALIDEWTDAADEESFLAEHRDELLAPEVASILAQRRDSGDADADTRLAVLVLSQRGEPGVAHRILDDPESGIALLKPAWRSADAERLSALATLCLQADMLGDEHRRLATVALAIGQAAAGRLEDASQLAVSALADVTDDEERNQLIGAVSDSLAYQPAHHEELIELLRALRSPTS
jgi:tetratricopeptide (TPR) repeat protein